MPDLKSELRKLEALKFDDEGTTQQESTMHQPPEPPAKIVETMFELVKKHPGCSRANLVVLAELSGILRASSSSLLSQFVKRGIIRITDTPEGPTYFAVAQHYKPGYVRKPKKAAKVATPKAAPVVATQPPQDTDVHTLLNTMSIVKARAMYDELKKIFGA